MPSRWKNGLSRRGRLQHVQVFLRRHTRVYYACLPLVIACGTSAPQVDAGSGADAGNDAADAASESGSCAALGEDCSADKPCCEGVCSVLAGDPTSTCN